MTAIVGSNVKVEVQSATVADSPPISVTAITLANPGVVTANGHGLANGDVVKFAVSGGMVQLDGQAARVANVTTNTFELEGLDTTDYDAWTTGTIDTIESFATFASAQSISMPNPAPVKLDTTTLIQKVKTYVFGLPDAPDGSISGLFNPQGAAEAIIKTATQNNSSVVFRITFAAGQKRIFNAFVSGGSGFTMASNQVATATTAFTPLGYVLDYAS